MENNLSVVSVVSDSGPLIHLSQINKLQILKELFGCISVPPSVKAEVVDQGIRRKRPDAEIASKAFRDGWIKTEALPAAILRQAGKLAEGEGISLIDAQVILLAKNANALFLTDDTALSRIAVMYGLKTFDTWMLLLSALNKNLVTMTEINEGIDELGNKKFKLNEEQTKAILQAAQLIEKTKKHT
jgi:uncharacterized protein